MVTAEQFRRLALALPGTEEGSHQGHPDFRVNGRVFASLDAKETVGMAVVTPVQQRQLVQASSAFRVANGMWGKQGCTMLQLDLAVADHAAGALTMAWEGAMLTASITGAGKPRKKAAAKKASSTKAVAKQPTAKKPTAEKPAAKKPAAKKAAAKKPVASRTAKKTSAKRSRR